MSSELSEAAALEGVNAGLRALDKASNAMMCLVDPTLIVMHRENFLQVHDSTRWCTQAWGHKPARTIIGPQEGQPVSWEMAQSIAGHFRFARKRHPESFKVCKCHDSPSRERALKREKERESL